MAATPSMSQIREQIAGLQRRLEELRRVGAELEAELAALSQGDQAAAGNAATPAQTSAPTADEWLRDYQEYQERHTRAVPLQSEASTAAWYMNKVVRFGLQLSPAEIERIAATNPRAARQIEAERELDAAYRAVCALSPDADPAQQAQALAAFSQALRTRNEELVIAWGVNGPMQISADDAAGFEGLRKGATSKFRLQVVMGMGLLNPRLSNALASMEASGQLWGFLNDPQSGKLFDSYVRAMRDRQPRRAPRLGDELLAAAIQASARGLAEPASPGKRGLRCFACGHEWIPESETPTFCPHCHATLSKTGVIAVGTQPPEGVTFVRPDQDEEESPESAPSQADVDLNTSDAVRARQLVYGEQWWLDRDGKAVFGLYQVGYAGPYDEQELRAATSMAVGCPECGYTSGHAPNCPNSDGEYYGDEDDPEGERRLEAWRAQQTGRASAEAEADTPATAPAPGQSFVAQRDIYTDAERGVIRAGQVVYFGRAANLGGRTRVYLHDETGRGVGLWESEFETGFARAPQSEDEPPRTLRCRKCGHEWEWNPGDEHRCSACQVLFSTVVPGEVVCFPVRMLRRSGQSSEEVSGEVFEIVRSHRFSALAGENERDAYEVSYAWRGKVGRETLRDVRIACKQCGHVWSPRHYAPKACPKCGASTDRLEILGFGVTPSAPSQAAPAAAERAGDEVADRLAAERAQLHTLESRLAASGLSVALQQGVMQSAVANNGVHTPGTLRAVMRRALQARLMSDGVEEAQAEQMSWDAVEKYGVPADQSSGIRLLTLIADYVRDNGLDVSSRDRHWAYINFLRCGVPVTPENVAAFLHARFTPETAQQHPAVSAFGAHPYLIGFANEPEQLSRRNTVALWHLATLIVDYPEGAPEALVAEARAVANLELSRDESYQADMHRFAEALATANGRLRCEGCGHWVSTGNSTDPASHAPSCQVISGGQAMTPQAPTLPASAEQPQPPTPGQSYVAQDDVPTGRGVISAGQPLTFEGFYTAGGTERVKLRYPDGRGVTVGKRQFEQMFTHEGDSSMLEATNEDEIDESADSADGDEGEDTHAAEMARRQKRQTFTSISYQLEDVRRGQITLTAEMLAGIRHNDPELALLLSDLEAGGSLREWLNAPEVMHYLGEYLETMANGWESSGVGMLSGLDELTTGMAEAGRVRRGTLSQTGAAEPEPAVPVRAASEAAAAPEGDASLDAIMAMLKDLQSQVSAAEQRNAQLRGELGQE